MDFLHESSVLLACFLADLSPKMRGKCGSPVTQSHAHEHVWNGSPARSRTALPGRKAEREEPSSRASTFLTIPGSLPPAQSTPAAVPRISFCAAVCGGGTGWRQPAGPLQSAADAAGSGGLREFLGPTRRLSPATATQPGRPQSLAQCETDRRGARTTAHAGSLDGRLVQVGQLCQITYLRNI